MSSKDGTSIPVPAVANRKRCRDDDDDDAGSKRNEDDSSSKQANTLEIIRQNKRVKRGGIFSYASSLWTSFTGFFFGVDEQAKCVTDDNNMQGGSCSDSSSSSSPCESNGQLDCTKIADATNEQSVPCESKIQSGRPPDNDKSANDIMQANPCACESDVMIQSDAHVAATSSRLNHSSGEKTGEYATIDEGNMAEKRDSLTVNRNVSITKVQESFSDYSRAGHGHMEQLDHAFEEKLALLLECKKRYGNFTITSKAEEKYLCLRSWVAQQRQDYKHGDINKQRREALERVGFPWNGRDARKKEQWESRFRQLLDFKEKQGHCNVPFYSSEYRTLSNWANRQKTAYRKILNGSMEARHINVWKKRIERLDQVGFEWSGYHTPRKRSPGRQVQPNTI